MSVHLCMAGSRFAALLALAVAAASCGGRVVSPEDDGENGVGDHDADLPVGSSSPPQTSAPVMGAPPLQMPTSTLSRVAASCDSANLVYADVLDAAGTNVAGGARLFPVEYAYSSSINTSTDYVEVSTFNSEGPNGIAVTVGGTADNAQPLAIQSYVEPSDDSDGGRPFLDLVIDGEHLMKDGTASGSFAITALAGNSPDGVLLPFAVAFDVTITSPAGVAEVLGCANWSP